MTLEYSELPDANRLALLKNFAKNINIDASIIDLKFLHQALTHKSYINELKGARHNPKLSTLSNQRLEFLGDAVLGMVIAGELYRRYPMENEGVLTKKKAMAVCEPTLAEIGKKLKVGEQLMLGKGELNTGGREKNSNIADALESIIGCLYLSGGFEVASDFIISHWQPYLDEKKRAQFSIDHKSILQEKLIKHNNLRPEYKVLKTSGPEHNKTFEVGLFIQGKMEVTASAQSRKKAEQKAALQYLSREPR